MRSALRLCSRAPRSPFSKTTPSSRSPSIKEIAADGEPAADPIATPRLIRQTALEFDSLKPDQVIARLQPLAKPGNPWFGSAGEMTAMALIKQGKNAEAGRLFAAIAKDKTVPEIASRRAPSRSPARSASTPARALAAPLNRINDDQNDDFAGRPDDRRRLRRRRLQPPQEGPPKTPVLGERIRGPDERGDVAVDPATAALPMTLPEPVANTDWAQSGGNASKSMGQLALGTALGRAFTVQAGRGSCLTARLASAPVVADGRVYTIDTLGTVRAFDAQTGGQYLGEPDAQRPGQ